MLERKLSPVVVITVFAVLIIGGFTAGYWYIHAPKVNPSLRPQDHPFYHTYFSQVAVLVPEEDADGASPFAHTALERLRQSGLPTWDDERQAPDDRFSLAVEVHITETEAGLTADLTYQRAMYSSPQARVAFPCQVSLRQSFGPYPVKDERKKCIQRLIDEAMQNIIEVWRDTNAEDKR